MLERGKLDRGIVEIVDTESLVPQEHLLRKIDAAVDFNRIYEMVESLYCEDNGRPSIDPVVLFKMVLIQHLYGLPSLRRTAEEVSVNICYRWFLGYTLQEETPHFSTVSYNFRHRFTEETVNQVFVWILEEVAEAGYLSPKVVFIDGTHIKANANTKKQVKVQIPEASKHYARELMEEVNADREAHGKKPFADAKEKHAMRYTQYRGLVQVTNWVKLKFAAMNLKKLANWRWKDKCSSVFFILLLPPYTRNPVHASSVNRVSRQAAHSAECYLYENLFSH